MFEGGRIQPDAEGFVRYAQMSVRLQDRCAIEVVRVGFFQYRAFPDGTLDREHLGEIMATVPEAVFGRLHRSKQPPGVVDAEHMFAQRRLDHLSRWQPTKVELAQLRRLANRKAGRELL